MFNLEDIGLTQEKLQNRVVESISASIRGIVIFHIVKVCITTLPSAPTVRNFFSDFGVSLCILNEDNTSDKMADLQRGYDPY